MNRINFLGMKVNYIFLSCLGKYKHLAASPSASVLPLPSVWFPGMKSWVWHRAKAGRKLEAPHLVWRGRIHSWKTTAILNQVCNNTDNFSGSVIYKEWKSFVVSSKINLGRYLFGMWWRAFIQWCSPYFGILCLIGADFAFVCYKNIRNCSVYLLLSFILSSIY